MGYKEKVWSTEARRIKLRGLLEREQETEKRLRRGGIGEVTKG